VTNNPPTLPSSPPSTLVLKVTGRLVSKVQYMTLTWSGAKGATVDVYRDGAPHLNTNNDGRYVNTRRRLDRTSYTYKVCEKGSAVCSKSVRVNVR
jgi:thermitase